MRSTASLTVVAVLFCGCATLVDLHDLDPHDASTDAIDVSDASDAADGRVDASEEVSDAACDVSVSQIIPNQCAPETACAAEGGLKCSCAVFPERSR